MLDALNKYNHSDHFFFTVADNLGQVCNAPINKSGVYIIYALKNGKIELIYIGRSGKLNEDGTIFIRKAGLGGMKDRIVNGHQFGKVPRRISWKNQMLKENIEALDIYWFVTHNDSYIDNPRMIESELLKKHLEIYGRLPKWNNEI
jgi:hypothetical protein